MDKEGMKQGGRRGGGAACGEKKRRVMKGVKPGKGSAGRSNRREKSFEELADGGRGYFARMMRSVHDASVAWLKENDPTYKAAGGFCFGSKERRRGG